MIIELADVLVDTKSIASTPHGDSQVPGFA